MSLTEDIYPEFKCPPIGIILWNKITLMACIISEYAVLPNRRPISSLGKSYRKEICGSDISIKDLLVCSLEKYFYLTIRQSVEKLDFLPMDFLSALLNIFLIKVALLPPSFVSFSLWNRFGRDLTYSKYAVENVLRKSYKLSITSFNWFICTLQMKNNSYKN